MAKIKAINKKAVKISSSDSPEVEAYSPLPKPDCSSTFGPGVEVHSALSSTDMNASTQGLCSPFLKDTMACSCSWWPAQDPDGVVEETGNTWHNEIGCGSTTPDHDEHWQDLRFVVPKNGQILDAWDKKYQDNQNEIYIKDNWADDGTEPSPGNVWWESPDIFVRYHDEPVSNFPNANVDYFEGNPIYYRKNFLYARVRNKGQHAIDHVFVKFYACVPWSPNPQWEYVGHAMLREVPAGAVRVVKCIKPFIPKVVSSHACLMVILDSTQDPVKLLGTAANFGGYDEIAGPQPQNVSVHDDNNVAQRNIKTILLVLSWGWKPIKITIHPHYPPHLVTGATPKHTLEVMSPTLPKDSIEIKFPENLRATSTASAEKQAYKFTFTERAPVEATVVLKPSKSMKMGPEHKVVLTHKVDRHIVGGVTINVRVTGERPIRIVGDSAKQVVHVANCKYAKELHNETKVAFESINEAISEGYKPHHECLKEYRGLYLVPEPEVYKE